MSDETHFVDASLIVASLKQHAVIKIAETLICHDLEEFCNFDMLYSRSSELQQLTANVEQLGIPQSCQNDIRSTILSLYRNLTNFGIMFLRSIAPSNVKFNARGGVDVYRTFEDCMKQIRGCPRTPRTCLYYLLGEACDFYQEEFVLELLCKLAKWKKSGLELSLRNATSEVEVIDHHGRWHCDISFVLEDVVDPAPWASFVTTLNSNYVGIEVEFFGNILKVSTRETGKMLPIWPKMTTIVKYDYAARFFVAALKDIHVDTCLVVQTMHYLNSTERTSLIKSNLVSFLLCFLTHPYYRQFLPDLPLVEEDIELLVEEDVSEDLERLIVPLEDTGDYTNYSDSLVQLWTYVSSRNKSVGNRVYSCIRAFLSRVDYEFQERFDEDWPEDDDAMNAAMKLREIFVID